MPTAFTIIDEGTPKSFETNREGRAIRIPPESLGRALGWDLKPQGFCKDDLCYPLPSKGDLVTTAGVDLGAFAELIGRPLALDADESAGYFGVPASIRAERLASLEAPDFTLPDLDGRLHSLSDYRGKKVLLAAYGSW